MNIQEAKDEILRTLRAYFEKNEEGRYVIDTIRQRPLLLIGPPGVGKTQIVRQVSEETGTPLVSYTMTHHTRQSAVGLPFIEKKEYGGKTYSVTEYTMSEIIASVYDKIEESGKPEGILFLDEINCVSETLAPTMLQFLQAKLFGNHRLPEGWLIIAAGNPPEYNKSVREFDVVTLDRIRRIDIEPSYDAWKKYAAKQLLHPAVTTYLGIKPENFCRFETTVDGRFFATPRGWEDLSELMTSYEALGLPISGELVREFIQHPKTARDFSNYYDLYCRYASEYRVDEILEGKIRETLCDRLKKAPFDEKYAVVGLLVSKLSTGCRDLERRAKHLTELREQYHAAEAAASLSPSALSVPSVPSAPLAPSAPSVSSAPSVPPASSVPQSSPENLETLRAAFNRLSDEYEDAFDEMGLKLEHAFDFMEAAFGASQEMVLFLTELNAGYYLIRFLKDYSCERYYQYNRDLLFEDQEAALQKKIAALPQG